MDIQAIKTTISEIIGTVDDGLDGPCFKCVDNDGTEYIFAVCTINSRNGKYQFQLQRGDVIWKYYEESKNLQKKFFIILPDREGFVSEDYYVFAELCEDESQKESYNFTVELPVVENPTHVIRVKKESQKKVYYISYIPAKDAAGSPTTEYLKHYLYSFDSRPYSKYVANYMDFLLREGKDTEKVDKISATWPSNFLIAGAPGTGKSYKLNKEATETIKKELCTDYKNKHNKTTKNEDEMLEDMAKENGFKKEDAVRNFLEVIYKERIRRVTFYEDYTYESFVGCYKPLPEEKDDVHEIKINTHNGEMNVNGKTKAMRIVYEYEPGPFIKTYIDAKTNPSINYFLLIEEINRAKAASVFGDMFQLLDRKDGVSEYYITPEPTLKKYLKDNLSNYDGTMKLPANMYIWATMNNADQGVFPLDSAFKRRWGYLYLDVNSSIYNDEMEGKSIKISRDSEVRWNIFISELNRLILDVTNGAEDKCLGAWYFKDEEIMQIKRFFTAELNERSELLNPLSDKLLIYLLNDVCRMDPSSIFSDDYSNMPKIKRAFRENMGLSLKDILDKLNWDEIDKQQKKWEEKNKEVHNKDMDLIESTEGTETDDSEASSNDDNDPDSNEANEEGAASSSGNPATE